MPVVEVKFCVGGWQTGGDEDIYHLLPYACLPLKAGPSTPILTFIFLGIHGWILGFLCFILGLCCAAGGSDFKHFIVRFRYVLLALASAFWVGNGIYFAASNFETMMPNVFFGMQCLVSMGAVSGLVTAHLNKATPFFRYARVAVFPVYILHYPIQFILSYVLFPLSASSRA